MSVILLVTGAYMIYWLIVIYCDLRSERFERFERSAFRSNKEKVKAGRSGVVLVVRCGRCQSEFKGFSARFWKTIKRCPECGAKWKWHRW